ncbi:MAG: isoprenylcysteine carboxylmethyltransferase family protein [Candidatus Levybacteria bacterium]|nr:isoprenylcysteine carboxylmethyltransferase family protein [Candidatus Levybacteria bacterium]
MMLRNLLKSLLHNIGVIIVGLIIVFLGTKLDFLFGISNFRSPLATSAGLLSLTVGFLLRVWATFHFYQHKMKVISLAPQNKLITSGPYRFSRNPLYLGGNVFIFFGATLLFGSPSGIFITAITFFLTDFMIRKEEKQLERKFGKKWLSYKKQVRRWL